MSRKAEDSDVEIPDGGGPTTDERVRHYLERHPDKAYFGVQDYDDFYVSDDWPRRAYALPRKDIETLLSDIDEYTGEIAELQEAYKTLSAEKAGLLKYKDQAERSDAVIKSMRLNGARHHFVFAYDKYVEAAGRRLQFCRDCDKDKGHPAHFGQGSRYLDSREVEKASSVALERVADFLRGLGIGPAAAVSQELLAGLPGLPETKEGS
jgi:hypothetical protein